MIIAASEFQRHGVSVPVSVRPNCLSHPLRRSFPVDSSQDFPSSQKALFIMKSALSILSWASLVLGSPLGSVEKYTRALQGRGKYSESQ